MLAVADLTVMAGGTALVEALSFTLAKGETLAIAGESGSGKSLTALAIMGLLPANVRVSAGRIDLGGTDLVTLPEARMRALRGDRISMIFQDPMSSLNPRHRIATIIAGPLELHGFDDVARRVARALDQVGLPADLARRFPHEMSGGQRQRIGIARAIALEPDFILADEVVSGLDVSSQAQVLNLLERLVRDLGLTLAFISHDLSVVRRLCQRVMVMQGGRIIETRPTAELFATPEAAYTRELLAAIPLPDPAQPWV